MSVLTHEDGRASGTKALYTVGVIVVLLKYLIAGMTLTLGTTVYDGGSFDAAGSVGLIFALGSVFRSKNFIQAKWQANPNNPSASGPTP